MDDFNMIKFCSPHNSEFVLRKLWSIKHNKCFICGGHCDILDPGLLNAELLALDNPYNLGRIHEDCNDLLRKADSKVMGRLFRFGRIMESAYKKNEIPSLKNVLDFYDGSKYSLVYEFNDTELTYSFKESEDKEIHKSEIVIDELSGEKSAFIIAPIEYIFCDDIITKKEIDSKEIMRLVKEGLSAGLPLSHISFGRICDEKVSIIAGQEIAIAEILLGVKKIAIRLFLDSSLNELSQGL